MVEIVETGIKVPVEGEEEGGEGVEAVEEEAVVEMCGEVEDGGGGGRFGEDEVEAVEAA